MHSSRFDFSSLQTQQGYSERVVSAWRANNGGIAELRRKLTFGCEAASELTVDLELTAAENKVSHTFQAVEFFTDVFEQPVMPSHRV